MIRLLLSIWLLLSSQLSIGGQEPPIIDALIARRASEEYLRIASRLSPKLLKQIDPILPEEAIQKEISKQIVIELFVNVYGKVTRSQVVTGHPLLSDAALIAVRQWLYEPYRPEDDEYPRNVRFPVVLTFEKGKYSPISPKKPFSQPLTVTDALALAQRYMAKNQIDTSEHVLYAAERMAYDGAPTWRIAWTWLELNSRMRIDLDRKGQLELFVNDQNGSVTMPGHPSLPRDELKHTLPKRPPSPIGLQGHVTIEKEYTDIPGVWVSLRSQFGPWITVQTDGKGIYKIPPIPPGVYHLRAVLDGFFSRYRRIIIGGISPLAHDFTLSIIPVKEAVAPFKKWLAGSLLTEDKLPFPGVFIILKKDGKTIKQTISGEDGRFCLDNLKRGEYRLEMSLPDTEPTVRDITIGHEDETTLSPLTIPFIWEKTPISLEQAIFLAQQDPAVRQGSYTLHSAILLDEGHACRLVWADPQKADESSLTLVVDIDKNVIKVKDHPPSSTQQAHPNATLKGRLFLDDGVGVQGENVTLISRRGRRVQTMVNDNGDFCVTDLEPDIYLLKLKTPPGFSPIVRVIHLKAGETKKIELPLTIYRHICERVFLALAINGTVLVGDGMPFTSVKVTLEFPNGRRISDVVYDSGEYVFHSLKPGTYRLHFSVKDYETVVKTVTLKKDDSQMLDIHYPWPWETDQEIQVKPTHREKAP